MFWSFGPGKQRQQLGMQFWRCGNGQFRAMEVDGASAEIGGDAPRFGENEQPRRHIPNLDTRRPVAVEPPGRNIAKVESRRAKAAYRLTGMKPFDKAGHLNRPARDVGGKAHRQQGIL